MLLQRVIRTRKRYLGRYAMIHKLGIILEQSMDEQPSNTTLAFRYLAGGVTLPSLALTHGIAKAMRPNILEGKSLLHSVAAMGIPCATETLCAMGADPNQEDSLGGTPLDYAILNDRCDTATILVRYGARIGELTPPASRRMAQILAAAKPREPRNSLA
jgi:ankyrin repeat protein